MKIASNGKRAESEQVCVRIESGVVSMGLLDRVIEVDEGEEAGDAASGGSSSRGG